MGWIVDWLVPLNHGVSIGRSIADQASTFPSKYVIIVNFDQILHLFQMFLLLNLSMYLFARDRMTETMTYLEDIGSSVSWLKNAVIHVTDSGC